MIENNEKNKIDFIEVSKLLESRLKLKVLLGETGLSNKIYSKNLHRPQLALAGFFHNFHEGEIQIFGNTELAYLQQLTTEERIKAISNLLNFHIPCIIISNNNTIEENLLEICKNKNVAVLNSPYDLSRIFFILSEFLDDLFSYHIALYGTFVDVFGVGILFQGRSQIGKSEIALDLVERGHRLIADDSVFFTKKRESILIGTGTSVVKHNLEIRGVGFLNIRQMFGIRAVRLQKRLEIIVELVDWDENEQYTRTGFDKFYENILGIEIQKVILPIFPGKNITVIAEVIALNYLLRTYGYDSAIEFAKNQSEFIRRFEGYTGYIDKRLITDYQGDPE